jgi:hypothetical protein
MKEYWRMESVRGSSIYTGVSWDKRAQKWKAQIRIDGVRTYLGLFDDEEAAARAYNAKAESNPKKRLNFFSDDGQQQPLKSPKESATACAGYHCSNAEAMAPVVCQPPQAALTAQEVAVGASQSAHFSNFAVVATAAGQSPQVALKAPEVAIAASVSGDFVGIHPALGLHPHYAPQMAATFKSVFVIAAAVFKWAFKIAAFVVGAAVFGKGWVFAVFVISDFVWSIDS